MKKLLSLSVVLLFVFVLRINGQMAGGNLTLGWPQGEFKENVDRIAYGGSVEASLFKPGPVHPFNVGVSFGYIIYGDETVRRPFSNTISRVGVDVNTTNTMLNFHLMFKLHPFKGDVMPYAEGLIGGNYLFTESKIEDIDDGYELVSSTNFDDFSFSYGGGGGFLIKLVDKLEDDGGPSLYLDIKGRYLIGTEAEYLVQGSIEEDGQGSVTYKVDKSATDIFTFHIGVMFVF